MLQPRLRARPGVHKARPAPNETVGPRRHPQCNEDYGYCEKNISKKTATALAVGIIASGGVRTSERPPRSRSSRLSQVAIVIAICCVISIIVGFCVWCQRRGRGAPVSAEFADGVSLPDRPAQAPPVAIASK